MEQAARSAEAAAGGFEATRSAQLRLALALALLGVALGVAFAQRLRPAPLRAESTWEWLRYPRETNAFLRAPVVDGRLRDATQPAGSDHFWIVGDGGVVLHSPDLGATWERVVLPDAPAQPPAGARTARWRWPALLGEAQAGEDPDAAKKLDAPPEQRPAPAAAEMDEPAYAQQRPRPKAQPRAIEIAEPALPEEEPQLPETPPAPHEAPLALVKFVGEELGWIFSSQGYVWRTSDAGATWTRVADAAAGLRDPSDASFADASHAWVATRDGVLESADGGMSWRPLYAGKGPLLATDVALLGAGRGRAVDAQQVFDTDDAGSSWRSLADVKLPIAGPSLAEDGTVWALATAPLGIVTLDASSSAGWVRTAWMPPDGERDPGSFQIVAFNARRACLRREQALSCTQDGGTTWTAQPGPAAGTLRAQPDGTAWWIDGGSVRHAAAGAARFDLLLAAPFRTDTALDALDRNHIVTLAGAVLHGASDAGRSFALLAPDVGAPAGSVAFRDAQHGFLGSIDGPARVTADGGRTWSALQPGSYAYQFSCRPDAACLALAEDGLGVSSDGGISWRSVLGWSTDRDEGDAIILVAQARGSEPAAWAVHTDGTLSQSSDDGASWTRTSRSVPEGARSLALVDARTAWAGGKRLWRTTDAGVTWEARPVGRETGIQRVSFASPDLGLVSTLDGALLRTADGGETWAPLEHRRGAAPWLYLACASIALLVWPWESRAPRVERTIADVLASDRPLRSGDLDALRFGVVAEGLADFLKNSRTEPPLTLAITGEWGSGKSSLMNLLKDRLEDARYRPVFFNAWHHQKGEHLFASLYANIREQAIPPVTSRAGLRYRVQLLATRIAARPYFFMLIGGSIAMFLAWAAQDWSRPGLLLRNVADPLLSGPMQQPDDFLIALMKALGMATAPGILVPIFRALRAFGVDPARLRNSSLEPGATSKVEPGARFAFAREFAQFTRSLRPRTLVVFIDDLDRCSKEHVVEVLEAVNFLVVSGRCFIVIAMAEEWVERCVELAFDDLAQGMTAEPNGDPRRDFARKYLEKLINIRVPIRKPTEQESRALIATMSAQRAQPSRPSPRATLDRLVNYWLPVAVAPVVAVVLGWFQGLQLSAPPTLPDAAPPPEARGQLVFSEGGGASGESVELSFPVHAPSERQGIGPHVVGEIPFGELRAQLVLEEGEKSEKAEQAAKRLLGPFPVAGGRSLSVLLPGGATPAAPAGGIAPPAPPTADPLRPPTQVWISERDPGSGIGWLGLAGLAGLILSALYGWVRSEPPVVHDSEEFSRALEAWVPWILAKRDTPRALKRFINHVRYVAMRVRAEARETPEARLDEQELVALASLYHFDRRLVTDGEAFRDACAGHVEAALKRLQAQGAAPGELEGAADAFAHGPAPTIRPPLRERFLAIMADLAPVAPAPPPAAAEPS